MAEASEVPFGLEVTKGLVAKFLMAILGFVGTILFARILGPVSFGGFYLVMAIVGISKLPVDGFASASMKRYSESESGRSEIVGATLIVVTVTSLLATVVVSLFRGSMATFTGLPNAHLLFVLLFVTTAVFVPLQKMVSGTGKISRTVWIDFIRSIFTTPIQLVFILLGFGAAGMAYGLSFATAITIPISYHYIGEKPSIPEWKTIKNLWSFARFSTLASTLNRIYGRIDVLLLGALLTPAAVGHYEVALKLTIPAAFVSEIAGEGLMARVSNLINKEESVSTDVSNTLSLSSVLAIPLFFGASVIAEPLVVTLYGAEYAEASVLLIGLALFRVFQTQSNPLMQTIKGLDRPDVTVWIAAGTLALNVPLGIILTLQIGAPGVVVATVIAEGTKYLAAASWIRRTEPRVDIVSRMLAEQILSGAVMAGAVAGLHHWVPVQSWIDLLALVGAGAVLYSSFLLLISYRLRYTVSSIVRDADVDLEV